MTAERLVGLGLTGVGYLAFAVFVAVVASYFVFLMFVYGAPISIFGFFLSFGAYIEWIIDGIGSL